MDSGTGVFAWLGPVVLLVSALLTAGYLLPIVMKGFFPGEGYNYPERKPSKEDPCMLIPVMLLTALAVGLGIWPNPLIEYISGIVSGIL